MGEYNDSIRQERDIEKIKEMLDKEIPEDIITSLYPQDLVALVKSGREAIPPVKADKGSLGFRLAEAVYQRTQLDDNFYLEILEKETPFAKKQVWMGKYDGNNRIFLDTIDPVGPIAIPDDLRFETARMLAEPYETVTRTDDGLLQVHSPYPAPYIAESLDGRIAVDQYQIGGGILAEIYFEASANQLWLTRAGKKVCHGSYRNNSDPNVAALLAPECIEHTIRDFLLEEGEILAFEKGFYQIS